VNPVQGPPPARTVITYVTPSSRRPPSMRPFVVIALLLLGCGFVLADAGNLGKGGYDWRAAAGFGCVASAIVLYFAGRWASRRARRELELRPSHPSDRP
jgi:hypothetical protein